MDSTVANFDTPTTEESYDEFAARFRQFWSDFFGGNLGCPARTEPDPIILATHRDVLVRLVETLVMVCGTDRTAGTLREMADAIEQGVNDSFDGLDSIRAAMK